jgi:hypothetical protein
MTRDEVKRRMSSKELTEWMAYCELGEEQRQWERSLMLMKEGVRL